MAVGLYVVFASVVLMIVAVVLRILLGSFAVLFRILCWVLGLLVRGIVLIVYAIRDGIWALQDRRWDRRRRLPLDGGQESDLGAGEIESSR